ncbi:MAG: hypothetical protein ACPIOQ_38085 [Promethearchaeia archaeon]
MTEHRQATAALNEDYDAEMIEPDDAEEHLMQLARQPVRKNDKTKRDRGKSSTDLAMPWGEGTGRNLCSDGRKPLIGQCMQIDCLL